jgi:hypothetical protein
MAWDKGTEGFLFLPLNFRQINKQLPFIRFVFEFFHQFIHVWAHKSAFPAYHKKTISGFSNYRNFHTFSQEITVLQP